MNGRITMNLTKNKTIDLEIVDFTNEGEGVGHAEGCTFFVKDAVIGDVVTAVITKVKKNYAYARIRDIIVPSPYRVDAQCPEARRCGGCQIRTLSYEMQLKFKQNKVLNNLIRLGGFDREEMERIMEPIIGMDEKSRLRYRNKAQYPVGKNKEGSLITGFFAGRTHAIIPIDDCLIGIPENKKILKIITDWMIKYDISAYDEINHEGTVRHILIRKGFETGELMVCLVINADHLKRDKELIEMLASGLSEESSRLSHISYSVNKKDTNVIMGDTYKTIWGKDTITDRIGDLSFRISPLSFYQVNPIQTKRLYEKALQYADLQGEETVWDLYCGIGTISIFLAQNAKQVSGVEIIPQAIEDARANAVMNGIENAEFYVGKAEEVVDRLKSRPDVVVVDPPRKGCDDNCLQTILKTSPNRIVYISCDSATLARDLKILCAGGYRLKALTPCDMFPETVHVETVCLLSNTQRKKKESYITLDVEMEDYYRIKNEGKNSNTGK